MESEAIIENLKALLREEKKLVIQKDAEIFKLRVELKQAQENLRTLWNKNIPE